MNFIHLAYVFAFLCQWQFGNAAPYISIQSSSRSRSAQVIDGKLKTVYDIKTQLNANDLTGKMVQNQKASFKSDLIPSFSLQQVGNDGLIIIE